MNPANLSFIVCAVLVAGAVAASGQTPAPGPQEATFTSSVDGTSQAYGLYVPKNFDAKRKYPLVMMLHGATLNNRLALRRVFGKGNKPGESDADATKYFPEWKDIDYIVATPMARGTMGYQGIPEQDVYDVLSDVEHRFPIDRDRVYLTGLSMGGGGTFWLGLTRPDIWAAIAPLCPAWPPAAIDLAPNALNYPVHVSQGSADPAVNPAKTREMVLSLQGAGAKVEYMEYPGVEHNCWDLTYKDEAIFKWFEPFRRNAFPERVHFVTGRYKYPGAWWVQLDTFTPGTPAGIDAKFSGRNRIEATTSEVDAFTLKLAGHPKFDAKSALDVTVNGKAFKLAPGEATSFTKQRTGWAVGKFEPSAAAKGPGREGPLFQAIEGLHIYIYGTADKPAPDELQKRKAQAELASHWYAGKDDWGNGKATPLRVLADSEVTDADLARCDLILFGTAENNSLIKKFSDRLPLALNANAAGYGLVYIFPVGDHCALINSGLPWWTVPEGARQPGRSWMGPAGMLQTTEMDFVLFRDSWNDVVADGRFDRNWKLPAGTAQQLRTSRVVTVNRNASSAPARGGL